MEDENMFAMRPSARGPDSSSESPGACRARGVSESQFPCQGKCSNKNVTESGARYEALCPHCSVWTSLPEGAALKVTHIFDCIACGYGKRITEGDK